MCFITENLAIMQVSGVQNSLPNVSYMIHVLYTKPKFEKPQVFPAEMPEIHKSYDLYM